MTELPRDRFGPLGRSLGYVIAVAGIAMVIYMTAKARDLPRASLAWQHAFAALTPTTTLTFRNTGAAFGIWGVPTARDVALVEGAAICSSARRLRSVSFMSAS